MNMEMRKAKVKLGKIKLSAATGASVHGVVMVISAAKQKKWDYTTRKNPFPPFFVQSIYNFIHTCSVKINRNRAQLSS